MSLYPYSQLDGNQILQGAYDEANQLIRTSATILIAPTVNVTQGTSPWVVSGTVSATQSGTWNINNISGTISLPTNAAQESGGHLASIDTKLPNGLTVTSNRLLVDGSGVVQPVSGTVAATQSGTWTTARSWTLNSGTDSITAVISGTVPVSGTLTVNQGTSPWVTSATQSGTWTVQQGTPPWSVSQSGTWNINNISGTVSLPTGASTETTLSTFSNRFSSSTSSITSVASSASNVSLLSSNANRKFASFYNDSTTNCFLKLGTTASATSFTIKMTPASFLILNNDPIYTGGIDGIWDSANGNMRITELT